MRSPKAAATENSNHPNPFVDATHWLTIAGLVLVPLVFSTAVLNIFAAPKFAVLLTVSTALVPLLTWMLFNSSERRKDFRRALMTKPVLLVSLYVFVIL